MTATVHALQPATPPDPAAELTELVRYGLTIARAAARLAEMEHDAADALAEASAAANRALLAEPASPEEAYAIGHDADLADTAREGSRARIAALAETYERVARAVRRAIILRAQLASGRPFRAAPLAGEARPGEPARSAARPANANDPDRAEPAERRTDDCRSDWTDETAGRPDAAVMDAIRRDLGIAAPPEPPAPPRYSPGPPPAGRDPQALRASLTPSPALPRPDT